MNHIPNQNFRVRQRLWKSCFGQKKTSPFLWGRTSSDHAGQIISNWHAEFWSGRQPKINAVSGDQSDAEGIDGRDHHLLQTAALAYGFEYVSGSTGKDVDLLPDHRSLKCQMHLIENAIWEFAFESRIDISVVQDQWKVLLEKILDGDGWINASAVGQTSVLASSWCRCHLILETVRSGIDSGVESLLQRFYVQLNKISKFSRGLLFSSDDFGLQPKPFRKSIERLWHSDDHGGLGADSEDGHAENHYGAISEWGQIGVLRSHAKKSACRIGFLFDRRRNWLEIDRQVNWVAGDCTPRMFDQDEELSIGGEIGVSAWIQNELLEYIELEFDFGSGVLYRQIVLLRKNQLLFLNDCFRGETETGFEYVCQFTTANGISVVPEKQSSEFYLRDNNDKRILFLPLCMPEWKSPVADGRIATNQAGFIVNRSFTGRGGSSALLVDLNPKRSNRPRTWRKLTVAENRQIVPESTAVAYRVQTGRKQLVFYRAIDQIGNRTFIGQNFANEFLVGQIDVEGNFHSLLEIE